MRQFVPREMARRKRIGPQTKPAAQSRTGKSSMDLFIGFHRHNLNGDSIADKWFMATFVFHEDIAVRADADMKGTKACPWMSLGEAIGFAITGYRIRNPDSPNCDFEFLLHNSENPDAVQYPRSPTCMFCTNASGSKSMIFPFIVAVRTAYRAAAMILPSSSFL